MTKESSSIALEEGLDLRQLLGTGSVLHINFDYGDNDETIDSDKYAKETADFIGEPIESFDLLEKKLATVDNHGFVKKKIFEEGGGLPLHDGCTVSIIYSGYWENELEPFDFRKLHKPLLVDLKDNSLLPGLEIAIRSMLVGETALFLLSHEVMFGELGVPPRIKPKAKCVFYVKLLKSILTSKEGDIDFSQPNMFQKVQKEAKQLYASGIMLHKSKNTSAAIQVFRKGVFMLHKCRLADEEEEKTRDKLLSKLYTNLTICYNLTNQPLKSCTACNELNRLNSLWNNSKALYQNAKALRMIGEFNGAEKRLRRAMKLSPERVEMQEELQLLQQTHANCNQNKLITKKIIGSSLDLISDDFKKQVDDLIKNFKENINLCILTLPSGLNSVELGYIKEVCIRENLFCNRIQKKYALDKNERGPNEDTNAPLENFNEFQDYF